MLIDGVEITVKGGTMTEAEMLAYIKHVREQKKGLPKELTITIDGEYVELECRMASVPFDRIRRITGYLVGTLDRFNNGKRAEERDRVKHGV